MKKWILVLTSLTQVSYALAYEGNPTLSIGNDKDAERVHACVRFQQAQTQLIKNKAQLKLMSDYEESNGTSEGVQDLRKLSDVPDKVVNYGVTTGATISTVGATSLALRKAQQHEKVVVRAGARLAFFQPATAKRLIVGGIVVAGSSAIASIVLDKFYVNSETNIARREMLDFLDSTQAEEKRVTRDDMKKYLQEENTRLIAEQKQLNQIIDQLAPEEAKQDPAARCEFNVSTYDQRPGGIIR
jgi:hypothetical protein